MSPLDLTCKRCGGGAAERGLGWQPIGKLDDGKVHGYAELICDAPLHRASQRVVEAAVALTEWYGVTQLQELRAAVAALLAAREEDANAD